MLKKKLIIIYQKLVFLCFGKTIENVYDEFINYKIYQNSSKETIQYYNDNFKLLTKFCNANTRIKKINEQTIIDYVTYMRNKKVNDVTINTRLTACRAFLYFCMKKNYIKNFSIKLIKVRNSKDKKPYTDEEVKRLLQMPNFDKSAKINFINLRNWVMTNYALSTR
ncbi:tyrosine-type recombinase/integrase [Robinsoniella peoriensis]|uniref:tyrosine-type recombinase/integrase n=1 Tax=Robinsoniella peoriensis TaxID=180332 RepID=UPI0037534F00